MGAALLLAAAVLIGAGARPGTARAQAGRRRPRRVRRDPAETGPAALAAALDVFALCLDAGMPVPAAAAATAAAAPPVLADALRRGADRLLLGAGPATAWAPPPGGADPRVAALLRLARRSGDSGIALAAGVRELAGQCRQNAVDAATATAERAGVLIAAPLGVCFLPAFVCLGLVPVVAGLAGDVLRSGLW